MRRRTTAERGCSSSRPLHVLILVTFLEETTGGRPVICEHCRKELPRNQMAKLSNGDPSKCCLGCWEEFESTRARANAALPEKWTQDRRYEEQAGCFDPNSDPEVVKESARKLKGR